MFNWKRKATYEEFAKFRQEVLAGFDKIVERLNKIDPLPKTKHFSLKEEEAEIMIRALKSIPHATEESKEEMDSIIKLLENSPF